MKKVLLTLFAILAVLPAMAQQKFRSADSIQDIRVDVGFYSPLEKSNSAYAASMAAVHYTRNFWSVFAYSLGGQVIWDLPGASYMAGLPAAIAFRPGIAPAAERAGQALEFAVADTMVDSIFGDYENLGNDLLADLLFFLFRRFEFFAGLTPGMAIGVVDQESPASFSDRFSLTADVGLVLSIPIWHFSLNVAPVYHYSILSNPAFPLDSGLSRHQLSISAGLGWLF